MPSGSDLFFKLHFASDQLFKRWTCSRLSAANVQCLEPAFGAVSRGRAIVLVVASCKGLCGHPRLGYDGLRPGLLADSRGRLARCLDLYIYDVLGGIVAGLPALAWLLGRGYGGTEGRDGSRSCQGSNSPPHGVNWSLAGGARVREGRGGRAAPLLGVISGSWTVGRSSFSSRRPCSRLLPVQSLTMHLALRPRCGRLIWSTKIHSMHL